LKDFYERLGELDFTVEFTEEAKEFIANKGYDPKFGARPLHRAIQKYVEDPLAEFILNENPKKDSILEISLDENKIIKVSVLSKNKQKSKKK
jgi:ATP-dependent Clp protease ATP-binding subunit ClpC